MIENPNLVRAGASFERNGEEYTIIDVGNDIQVKAPSDANWHHAVVYRSVNTDTRYVRSLTDFCQKFDEIPLPTSDEEEE